MAQNEPHEKKEKKKDCRLHSGILYCIIAYKNEEHLFFFIICLIIMSLLQNRSKVKPNKL